MYIRKLVKAGQSSHTISLPKLFIERNNLGRGDTLYMTDLSDTELKVSVMMEKKHAEGPTSIEIMTSKKALSTIQRELTAAYINNYNTIKLVGDNISEFSKELRETIHHFVALEIAEQTRNSIVARDLLNAEEISVDETIKRMDMILRSIISDSYATLEGKDHSSSIMYRDEDVNRLYFLLSRILKSSMKRRDNAASYNLKHEEIMGKWLLVVNIENIADAAKNLNECYSRLKNKKEDIKEFHFQAEQSYLDVMKSYYTRDRKLADNVAMRRASLFEALSKFYEKNKTIDVAELVHGVKELMTHIGNIAKIVIDEQ